MTQEYEIAIVGSGPAGVAAALKIGEMAPELAERVVLLEAGRHPREKICAGCVTGRSWRLLENLGLKINVNYKPVNSVRFITAIGDITLPRAAVARIVRRSEFDAALAAQLREKGIAIHEGARMLSAARFGDRIEITAARSPADGKPSNTISEEKYLARAVIGADGATSAVRRRLGKTARRPIRTVMVKLPIPPNFSALPEDLIVFDFRPSSYCLRGYRWIFPCLGEKDEPSLSVGVCDFDPMRRRDLRPEVEDLLNEYGLSSCAHSGEWREYPFYAFDTRDTLGGPGWLLAGEAAGSDNLLAEGISYAIESGVLAGEFVAQAFQSNNLSMENYTHYYHWSRVGKELRTLKVLADMFYSPLLHMRVLRAGLFNDELCAIGGEILAGEIEPRTKLALRIAYNLFKTMAGHALSPLKITN